MEHDRRVFLEGLPIESQRNSCVAASCLCLSVIIVSIILIAAIISADYGRAYKETDHVWFPYMGSESCIRLFDIDGDGLDDIIFGLTDVTVISLNETVDEDRKQLCASLGVEYPCSGSILGVRGYDFKIIWKMSIKQSIFELMCDTVDLDGDGKVDCIGAGRQGTLIAFDPRRGKMIWNNSSIPARHPLWNMYNPVVLMKDLDNDGVNDLVVAHGGNPTFPSEIHDRDAGCLLLISGRTGQQIGEPFWMPDGRETYMSPVLYDETVVLFGTGGETIDGSLYGVTVDNIVQNQNRSMHLFQSATKGVMVPPVILDLDFDGYMDVLVSGFDGTLQLIDGRTLNTLWMRSFSEYEFYASPAPGDFNGDGFTDFMVILNHGNWDRYDHTMMMIIDGLNGETVWRKKSSWNEFSSPLTVELKINGARRDGFVFRQRGETKESTAVQGSSVLFHGIGLQDGEIRRMENDSKREEKVCDDLTVEDSVVYLNFVEEDGAWPIGKIYPPVKSNEMCSEFEPMERTSGAIGDLNGDGILDVVDLTTFNRKLNSHSLNGFVAHVVLTRFSLNFDRSTFDVVSNVEIKEIDRSKATENLRKTSKKTLKREIVRKQCWNSYLGRKGNSHYESPLVEKTF